MNACATSITEEHDGKTPIGSPVYLPVGHRMGSAVMYSITLPTLEDVLTPVRLLMAVRQYSPNVHPVDRAPASASISVRIPLIRIYHLMPLLTAGEDGHRKQTRIRTAASATSFVSMYHPRPTGFVRASKTSDIWWGQNQQTIVWKILTKAPGIASPITTSYSTTCTSTHSGDIGLKRTGELRRARGQDCLTIFFYL